jgi:hypothetical protein
VLQSGLLVLGTAVALIGASGSLEARAPPLFRDPVRLNIGYVCRWQNVCMARQQSAMSDALRYVKRKDPPNWKIQLCNRQAARPRARVDWIGYNNCIRNSKLRKPRAPRR